MRADAEPASGAAGVGAGRALEYRRVWAHELPVWERRGWELSHGRDTTIHDVWGDPWADIWVVRQQPLVTRMIVACADWLRRRRGE